MASEKRESASPFFLGAGALFFLIAASVVVFAPWFTKDRVQHETITDINGHKVPARPYTDAQAHGRLIYIREVCWNCHSQAVRGDWVHTKDGNTLKEVPVAGDGDRYGPISQPAESAFDMPHLYGTRRIGPDLAREGGKFPDAWHLSHFLNPEAVTPGSIMPKFVWLYRNVKYDDKGEPISGEPTVELLDLISYLQCLGTGIGDWRSASSAAPESGGPANAGPAMNPDQLIKKGKELFASADCATCHGPNGEGNGPAAATFPPDHKPRNYHSDVFKWGDDMNDIMTTISSGRMPYMPAHPQFKHEQLMALASWIMTMRPKTPAESAPAKPAAPAPAQSAPAPKSPVPEKP